jgi:type I restriction enzyme, S subunit
MNSEKNVLIPKSWSRVTVEEITLPVIKIDPDDDPKRQITYIDISGIDNVRNKIGAIKQFQLSEAPSRARQIVHTGDVLFATVRPYLRNIATVPSDYDGEIASTGFSVLRPAQGIDPRFLFYNCIYGEFVNALSGAQYGVSYPAVKDEQVRAQYISLPPSNEQGRIVAKIEELFSELDKGIESLKTAREQLKVYRQAVLKHTFEGKLTADWREENQDKLETTEQLLGRIKQEHEAHYQRRLEEWKAAVKEWEAKGKKGKKPWLSGNSRSSHPIEKQRKYSL